MPPLGDGLRGAGAGGRARPCRIWRKERQTTAMRYIPARRARGAPPDLSACSRSAAESAPDRFVLVAAAVLSSGRNAPGDGGALPRDMRPLLALLGSPVLDEDTADRLLSGRLDPADTPPAYAPVARLVKAATGPATPEELAGEAAVIAAFTAMAHADPPTPVLRRASMPSKFLSVKAAAAMLAAVLSVGGVAAAATGMLPGRAAQQATDHASSAAGGGSSAQAQGNSQSAAKGPDATGSAKNGLCQAWQSGQGGTNGKREDSTAFQALATAAGGADKVDAYCQTATTAAKGHAGNGPDATGAAKDGLCKSWQAAQAGQGAANGKRMDSTAFNALATAAGGADKIGAYCQTATTATTQDHGQGQGQGGDSGGASQSSGHGQGGPPTTTG
jgi:hypothetical protein